MIHKPQARRQLNFLRGDEVVTKIGYIRKLPHGIWVVTQRTPIEKGHTWEVDQIVIAPDGHAESMRNNGKIHYGYPVFYRPNFVSDVIKIFGI